MGRVVRTRLPLALTAGAISLVVFSIWGGGGEVTPGEEVGAVSSPLGLLMFLPFVLVIFLSIKGWHIFESLTWGTLLALVISLATGALSFSTVFDIPAERGDSTGLIEDSLSSVVGPVILVLLILALTRTLADSGVMTWMLSKVQKAAARGVRSAELIIIGLGVLFTIPLGANAPAILMLGPTIAKPLGETFRLAPERRANLLDCAVCTVFYVLPWHNAVIVWYGVVLTTAATYGFATPSIWDALLNPYAWALLLVVVVSAITGWNRTYIKD
jgi:Na+/H+ antiporter NhaC